MHFNLIILSLLCLYMMIIIFKIIYDYLICKINIKKDDINNMVNIFFCYLNSKCINFQLVKNNKNNNDSDNNSNRSSGGGDYNNKLKMN